MLKILGLSSLLSASALVQIMDFAALQKDERLKVTLFVGDDEASSEMLSLFTEMSESQEWSTYNWIVVETHNDESAAEAMSQAALPVLYTYTPENQIQQWTDTFDMSTFAAFHEKRKIFTEDIAHKIIGYTSQENLFRLATDGPVFIKMYEEWCGHCKKIKKHFEIASIKTTGAAFLEIECSAVVRKGDTICKSFDVTSYPTIVMLAKGASVFDKYDGERTYEDFVEYVNRAGTLDYESSVTIQKPKPWYQLNFMSRYWTVGTFVAYFVFYTARNKKTQALELNEILDVVFFRKGSSHTFSETNKVLALACCTTLGLSLTPGFHFLVDSTGDLLTTSTLCLMLHACMSFVMFYGNTEKIPFKFNASKRKKNDDIKKKNQKSDLESYRAFGAVFGLLSLSLLVAWLFDSLSQSYWSMVAASVFAICHYYYMEVDSKGLLAVKPVGFIAFATPLIAVVATVAARVLSN